MEHIKQFMIIDDDVNNNYLCNYIIKSVARDIEITEFTNAEDGLKYIHQLSANEIKDEKIILFLDLKMPIIDGWGFLKRYDTLSSEIKDLFRIYIVSSSIDPTDKEKANENPYVQGYVVKPLTKGTVQNILTGLL
jgi:CheY-like chemotaxis protein